jgi:hypothetical protein
MRTKPQSIGLFLAACMLAATSSAGAESVLTDGQQAAVERARQALHQQHQRSSDVALAVESVAAKEWSDSSLGCRKPGVMYQQVITSGYVVVLREAERTHEVHVAGDRAVICSTASRAGLREPPPRVRATNIAALEARARADLGSKIGVAPEKIRVVQRVPKQWNTATLECSPDGDTEAPATIPGFKLYLRYETRMYTYHTDDERVFACPRMEVR